MILPMMVRPLSRFASFLLLAFLVGCSGKRTPAYNPDVGPFDEDGNYIEAWADNPPSRKKRRSQSKPEPRPEPRVASTPRRTSKPQSTPKPKPVVVKPKKIRHTVKKGDTLYGLARRYGTSVSAIQKANGLKGNIIRTGKTLVIPK
mgnify:CR=1 FL=1